MKKTIMTFVLCVSIVAVSSAVHAEQVYATKRGKKFHTAECKLMQNKETHSIERADAETKGMKACKICYKSAQPVEQTTKE